MSAIPKIFQFLKSQAEPCTVKQIADGTGYKTRYTLSCLKILMRRMPNQVLRRWDGERFWYYTPGTEPLILKIKPSCSRCLPFYNLLKKIIDECDPDKPDVELKLFGDRNYDGYITHWHLTKVVVNGKEITPTG